MYACNILKRNKNNLKIINKCYLSQYLSLFAIDISISSQNCLQ